MKNEVVIQHKRFLSLCEVCGGRRGKYQKKHSRCSRIKQKVFQK